MGTVETRFDRLRSTAAVELEDGTPAVLIELDSGQSFADGARDLCAGLLSALAYHGDALAREIGERYMDAEPDCHCADPSAHEPDCAWLVWSRRRAAP